MKKYILCITAFFLILSAGCSFPAENHQAGSHPPSSVVKPETPLIEDPVPKENPDESPPPSTPAEAEPNPRYYVDPKLFTIHSTDERNEEKLALLTFDDGPKGQVTLKILDILDKYNVKSIWFVNGFNYGWDYKADPAKAERFDQLIKEIDKRGHMIANHTWKHENLRKLSPEIQRKEILSMNELLESLTGKKTLYFRPPFGAYTDVQIQIMNEEGMQWMNWSVGSLDWETKDPNLVVQQVLSTMHNGGNILMHDFPVTAEALDPLLEQLTAQGYKFVLPNEIRAY